MNSRFACSGLEKQAFKVRFGAEALIDRTARIGVVIPSWVGYPPWNGVSASES